MRTGLFCIKSEKNTEPCVEIEDSNAINMVGGEKSISFPPASEKNTEPCVEIEDSNAINMVGGEKSISFPPAHRITITVAVVLLSKNIEGGGVSL